MCFVGRICAEERESLTVTIEKSFSVCAWKVVVEGVGTVLVNINAAFVGSE